MRRKDSGGTHARSFVRSVLAHMRNDRALLYGGIYLGLSLVAFAVVNYVMWSPSIDDPPTAIHYVVWVYCYVPLLVFRRAAGWDLQSFGFVLSSSAWVAIAISVLLGLLALLFHPDWLVLGQWGTSLIEAFARVGEELFFRGFVYLFALRLFGFKRKPYLWAAFFSAAAFALVHTQAFVPGTHISLGLIFLIGWLMAYLRHRTGSLLPAIAIHCFLNAHLTGMILGWTLYFAMVAVAAACGRRLGMPGFWGRHGREDGG